MNKSENYLKLVRVNQTLFRWQEKEQTVLDASPEVFDDWIRQYVEQIENVDTLTWPIHHRWNIINDVLQAGLLTLQERADGVDMLLSCGTKSEDFSSAD